MELYICLPVLRFIWRRLVIASGIWKELNENLLGELKGYERLYMCRMENECVRSLCDKNWEEKESEVGMSFCAQIW